MLVCVEGAHSKCEKVSDLRQAPRNPSAGSFAWESSSESCSTKRSRAQTKKSQGKNYVKGFKLKKGMNQQESKTRLPLRKCEFLCNSVSWQKCVQTLVRSPSNLLFKSTRPRMEPPCCFGFRAPSECMSCNMCFYDAIILRFCGFVVAHSPHYQWLLGLRPHYRSFGQSLFANC